MPYSYEIDHGRRLVVFTGIGPLTDAEVLAQSETLSADPEFHPEYSELNNLMEANVRPLSTDMIRGLAARLPLFSRKSRRALVVPTSLGFGMGRMFEQLLGGEAGEIRVFYSLEEAEEWLGLEPDPPAPPAVR